MPVIARPASFVRRVRQLGLKVFQKNIHLLARNSKRRESQWNARCKEKNLVGALDLIVEYVIGKEDLVIETMNQLKRVKSIATHLVWDAWFARSKFVRIAGIVMIITQLAKCSAEKIKIMTVH